MALSQAMSTAVTGLVTHQKAMDTIGNNLANVNTTGYKKYDFNFTTLFSATLQGGISSDATTGRGSINPLQIGLGVQTGSVTQNFLQGGFDQTGNPLDFALSGNGFFVLRTGNGYCYTRDGSFYLGDNYQLLAANGLQVQGVMANDGVIADTGQIEDIYINMGSVDEAHATSQVSFTGNLDATSTVSESTLLVSSLPADADAAAYLGDVSTSGSSTWNALASSTTGSSMINGGLVQTSAAYAVLNPYYDPTDPTSPAYIAANIDSNLSDVYYLSGNTWVKAFSGISDGDTISITFSKGGVEYDSDFEYDYDYAQTSGTSYTLGHFYTFLCGDVDRTAEVNTVADIEGLGNTDLTGGAMGTIAVSGHVSSGEYGGTSAYNVPVETAGAFTRTLYSSVDYGNNVLADSFNISVVSNLGDSNSISNIRINYSNVNYDNMFSADTEYGDLQGGATTTSITVYDSLGNPKSVQVTLSLVEQDTNFSTWRWSATSTDDTDNVWYVDPVTGEIMTNSVVGTGVIRFDSSGKYVSGAEVSESGGISLTLNDLGVSTPLVIDVTNGLRSGKQDLDFSSLSFVSLATSLTVASQNGNPPGTLESFSVTTDGVIQGVYSNGIVKDIARLVIALIPNQTGLLSVGNNLYYTSPSSGQAQIEFANVGGRAAVLNQQLEMSNVDMSAEFTDLISIQRGFQANTRVITTADEMLKELLNMKS